MVSVMGRWNRMNWCGSILATLWLLNPAAQCAGDEPASDSELAQYYGFTGVEITKLHERAEHLKSGDFNGDGLTDVAVMDNFTSSIRLLLQRPPGTGSEKAGSKVNELSSDKRFEDRRITMDRAIAELETGDFDADGRLDFAVIGPPDQLAVYYQPEAGRKDWSKKWTVRLPGLDPVSGILAAGDFNGDGRLDLAAAGKSSMFLLFQTEQGTLRAPETLISTSGRQGLLQAADLNGDGRTDLCYLAGEQTGRSVCARLQSASGRLGPEVSFTLQTPRAVTIAGLDSRPGAEVISVDGRNGRISVLQAEASQQSVGSLSERLLRYGIGGTESSRERAVAVADFDGDKLLDVLVNEPEQAQLLLYRQNGIDGLGPAEQYPALLGITEVASGDLDGDGRTEAVLLSSSEGVVAISRFDSGRLTFPEAIVRKPDGWELAALAVLPHAGQAQLIVGLSQGSGNSARLEYQRFRRDADGKWSRVAEDPKLELSGAVGQRGVRLVAMDVNADGRQDLLSIAAGQAKSGFHVLLQAENGSLSAAVSSSQLEAGVSSPGRVFVSGSGLLVARDSFARMLSWKDGGWQVSDQINAGEATARIESVAALDLDGQEGAEVVLLDAGIRKARILRREDNVYRPWREVELGAAPFSSAITADLNGDGRTDLLLVGSEQFGVLYIGRTDVTLKEMHGFESKREKAYPADVLAGDVNGDGVMDLVAIDTSINGVAILRFDEREGLREATSFRVFEEKRLVSEAADRGLQPREGLIVDVTGDGRADLLLLCHDRLLVYPQDAGEGAAAAPAGGG
jgi:hypothetical protein